MFDISLEPINRLASCLLSRGADETDLPKRIIDLKELQKDLISKGDEIDTAIASIQSQLDRTTGNTKWHADAKFHLRRYREEKKTLLAHINSSANILQSLTRLERAKINKEKQIEITNRKEKEREYKLKKALLFSEKALAKEKRLAAADNEGAIFARKFMKLAKEKIGESEYEKWIEETKRRLDQ